MSCSRACSSIVASNQLMNQLKNKKKLYPFYFNSQVVHGMTRSDVSEFKKLVAWLLFPPCSMRRDLDLAFFRKSNLWSKKAKKRKQLKKAKSRSLLKLHGGICSHATYFFNCDTSAWKCINHSIYSRKKRLKVNNVIKAPVKNGFQGQR